MWTLAICTSAWVLCGQYLEIDYPSEQQCYAALNETYKRQGKDAFKYVVCAPKQNIKQKK